MLTETVSLEVREPLLTVSWNTSTAPAAGTLGAVKLGVAVSKPVRPTGVGPDCCVQAYVMGLAGLFVS